MTQPIVLKSLTIRDTNYYGYEPRREVTYTGEFEFHGPSGKVTLKLDESLLKKILAVVAESMVESTKELARTLTADIISGVPALPAPPVETEEEEIF